MAYLKLIEMIWNLEFCTLRYLYKNKGEVKITFIVLKKGIKFVPCRPALKDNTKWMLVKWKKNYPRKIHANARRGAMKMLSKYMGKYK